MKKIMKKTGYILTIWIIVLFAIACSRKNSAEKRVYTEREKKILIPVVKQLTAYNNRDIDNFSLQFSKDVKLYIHETSKLFCDGREQLIKIYGKMFKKRVELNCKILKRIVRGNFVIDEEKVWGIKKDEFVYAVAIYEIKDGLIKRGWFIK
jgi:hypothetical protein